MRSRIVFFALVLACAGPSPAGTETPAPGALRVVTWNVHDLFDAVDDADTADATPSTAEVETKLARVGAVLARLDADVIVLQEVEHEGLLQRLANGPLGGRGYAAWLTEGHDPRGIDVGVLARVPFDRGPSHLDERGPDGAWLWARDVAELRLPGGFTLLGAHLASRVDPGADPRREAQAVALAARARALRAAGDAVLVAGDLNDLPEATPLAPLLGAPELVDLGAALPPDLAWTWSGHGARERLDYALLDARLAPLATARVDGGDGVSDASDHRPLVIDLWVGSG